MNLKLTAAAVATLGVLALAGCSTPSAGQSTAGATPAATQEQAAPADLTGEWVEESANAGGTQTATITADTISIDWVNTDDGTTAVYWIGTYAAPAKAGDFTWTSTRDQAATDSALLASTDPTKDFTFAGGKLSYKVTAMGVSKNVTLVRK